MSRPAGISTKAIGLLVAAGLMVLFAIIVWVSMTNSTALTTNQNPFPLDESEIPNIEETQTGGAMLVTMVDKNDPTRIAGTLKADRFEPIGDGRRRLDNPVSWIYLKDGRALKVSADFATMVMPDPNQPPESGTLEGNIHIELFGSTPTQGAPPPPNATPTLVANFDEPVEFERRYLRLRSPGHFDIASDQFDLAGTDLTVILNELRDRIELIDILEGDQLVIHPNPNPKPDPDPDATTPADPIKKPTTPSTETSNRSTEPSRLAQDTPSTNDATNPTADSTASSTSIAQLDPNLDQIADTLSRYHITFNDEVHAAISGSGSADADRLELWAALENSALPANAIRSISFAKQSPPPSSTPELPAPEPTPPPTSTNTNAKISPITNPTSPTNKPESKDITITWSGKLSVRPIDGDIPPELESDSLTLKLIADEGKGIAFDVPDRNLSVQASAATYHATRGIIQLDSTPTDEGIIKIEAIDAGSLIATSLIADLAKGTIDFKGRGLITSTSGSTDPDEFASIQWKDSGALTLAIINHTLTDRLKSARFFGTVIAKQAGNALGARTLDASFDPTRPSPISLTKLSLQDAVLSGASKSLLSGASLDIDFAPRSTNDRVDPIRLDARGKVFARNTESMLKADHLVTTMMRKLDGSMIVRTANAEGNINYTGVDRTRAMGDSLTADGINETMTLKGKDATVAQGGSSIVGNHINLNARRKGIEVIGPGSFDHDILLDNADPNADPNTMSSGHIRATWKRSMRFDDALGSIICDGQVRVVSTPDAYTRDTLTANRAEIKLTAVPTTDPINGSTTQRPANTSTRELIWARVYGHAPQGQDPIPATIESRTYAQDDPERVIGLIYLEGAQIIANNTDQTLDVPAPGTLLILDRSIKDAQSTATDTPMSSTGPGLTRFTWNGRMSLNRAAGTAHLTDTVVVRQKTISTGKIAQLETDQLDATFEFGKQNQDHSTRLLSADASGSVRFLFGDRELLADNADYDAITDSLFASGIDNKLVTLYDKATPTPMSARTMRWDLTKDRIEINAPTPTRTTTGG